MAGGKGHGRFKRPTRFANGSTAWKPSEPQVGGLTSSMGGRPQEEPLIVPISNVPAIHRMEVLEAGTLGPRTTQESRSQSGESMTTVQLLEIMQQQQAASKVDMMKMMKMQQQFMQQQWQQQQQQQQQL